MDGLVQGGCDSIANALELRLSCTNPGLLYSNFQTPLTLAGVINCLSIYIT